MRPRLLRFILLASISGCTTDGTTVSGSWVAASPEATGCHPGRSVEVSFGDDVQSTHESFDCSAGGFAMSNRGVSSSGIVLDVIEASTIVGRYHLDHVDFSKDLDLGLVTFGPPP